MLTDEEKKTVASQAIQNAIDQALDRNKATSRVLLTSYLKPITTVTWEGERPIVHVTNEKGETVSVDDHVAAMSRDNEFKTAFEHKVTTVTDEKPKLIDRNDQRTLNESIHDLASGKAELIDDKKPPVLGEHEIDPRNQAQLNANLHELARGEKTISYRR